MERTKYLSLIKEALHHFPVVALLGPRQVGKTTLARSFAEHSKVQPVHFFDLEDPEVRAQLKEPKLVLSNLTGIVVIDEIQHQQTLFPLLRTLADRKPLTARFLVLGSASSELVNQSSESLAGRIAFIEVRPISLSNEAHLDIGKLWLRGGFPLAYLAESDERCFIWLEQFARTFLERDLGQLGFNFPAETMRRFWMMLTHYHGQTLNGSDLGRSLDLSDTTVKRYTDCLAGTFMIRRLSPWYENISKRQVKQPKLYFRDSGILHRLLGIKSEIDLLHHPRLGASWEGFAIEQIISRYGADTSEVYFWGVHGQMDLDLLIAKEGKRHGFEVKHTTSPSFSPSLEEIRRHLKLDSLQVVHAGNRDFKLSEKISAVTLATASDQLQL